MDNGDKDIRMLHTSIEGITRGLRISAYYCTDYTSYLDTNDYAAILLSAKLSSNVPLDLMDTKISFLSHGSGSIYVRSVGDELNILSSKALFMQRPTYGSNSHVKKSQRKTEIGKRFKPNVTVAGVANWTVALQRFRPTTGRAKVYLDKLGLTVTAIFLINQDVYNLERSSDGNKICVTCKNPKCLTRNCEIIRSDELSIEGKGFWMNDGVYSIFLLHVTGTLTTKINRLPSDVLNDFNRAYNGSSSVFYDDQNETISERQDKRKITGTDNIRKRRRNIKYEEHQSDDDLTDTEDLTLISSFLSKMKNSGSIVPKKIYEPEEKIKVKEPSVSQPASTTAVISTINDVKQNHVLPDATQNAFSSTSSFVNVPLTNSYFNSFFTNPFNYQSSNYFTGGAALNPTFTAQNQLGSAFNFNPFGYDLGKKWESF